MLSSSVFVYFYDLDVDVRLTVFLEVWFLIVVFCSWVSWLFAKMVLDCCILFLGVCQN